jgi:probable phosphoglycerate mutase
LPVRPAGGQGEPVTWETVFLARHAQTEWNVQRRRQGRLDSPLTPAGREQTRRHAVALKTMAIDAIFTGPLGRTRETARIIGDALALQPVIVDDLAELDHGAFSGLTGEEIDARFPGERRRRASAKYEYRFPGGESYADAEVRVTRALAAAEGPRRPLLVAHEMVGRLVRRQLLGLDPAAAMGLHHPHDVIFRIDPGTRTSAVVA